MPDPAPALRPRRSGPRRALRAAIVAGVAMVAMAGCGSSSTHSAGGEATGLSSADANNNGSYVTAGHVTYQLQISRELNQYSTEDSYYVRGVPSGDASLTASQLWYGVFLWARNQTKQPQSTTDRFEIVDTEGNKYYPLTLNTELNPFAWTAETLRPNGTEPGPGTIASNGFTQGGLLLFKLNESVYSNRPLTFYILGPSNQKEASISLDV